MLYLEPISKDQRYSRTEKKHVTVRYPSTVSNYNKPRGGTDQMVQIANAYMIGIRGKKMVVVNFHLDNQSFTEKTLGCCNGRQIKENRFQNYIVA